MAGSKVRSLVRLSALALVVAASPAQAQSPIAGALAAIAHGEYERAAELLRPIAETDRGGDPTAQFLMATLYENGRGVPQRLLHACALYQRSAFDLESSPFSAQAMRLFRTVMMPRGPEFIGDCQMLARIGFDNRFEPVTFDLGPGHSIAWDLRGATVTYQGRSKVTPVVPPVPGIVFLPLQHTALRNPGPAGSLRHFVEMLFWAGNSADGWSLTWYLFEVVREDVVQIAVLNDVKTARERPGPNDRIDPRTVVSFALQSDGRVNWSIRR